MWCANSSILFYLLWVFLQSSDSDSQKKFPSKSCPLRYGTAKIQEDAFNLFQAGLREYIGLYGGKSEGSHYSGWGITSLSVSASKIVPIPSVSSKFTLFVVNHDLDMFFLDHLKLCIMCYSITTFGREHVQLRNIFIGKLHPTFLQYNHRRTSEWMQHICHPQVFFLCW